MRSRVAICLVLLSSAALPGTTLAAPPESAQDVDVPQLEVPYTDDDRAGDTRDDGDPEIALEVTTEVPQKAPGSKPAPVRRPPPSPSYAAPQSPRIALPFTGPPAGVTAVAGIALLLAGLALGKARPE